MHDSYELEQLPDGSVKLVGNGYVVVIDKPVAVVTEFFGSLGNTRSIIQLPLTGATVTITVDDASTLDYTDNTAWLGASEPGVVGWAWYYSNWDFKMMAQPNFIQEWAAALNTTPTSKAVRNGLLFGKAMNLPDL